MALPDLKFFTDVPYSKDWREEFKDFFQTLKDPNDALFFLNRYANNLTKLKDTDEASKKSKAIQVANRLHELKKKVFLQKKRVQPKDSLDKVGIVIVRNDNKAIFTIVNDGTTQKYGFPKGQFEYKLENANDIHSVYGEGYANGALRELNEETGFVFKGKINLGKDIYTGILERTIEGKHDKLSILGGDYAIFGDGFYLVLFVDSTKDLESEKVPTNTENIERVVWEHQYTEDSPRDYNVFSRHRLTFPSPDFFDVENNANGRENSPVNVRRRVKKSRQSRKKEKERSNEFSRKRSKSRSKSIRRPREHSK